MPEKTVISYSVAQKLQTAVRYEMIDFVHGEEATLAPGEDYGQEVDAQVKRVNSRMARSVKDYLDIRDGGGSPEDVPDSFKEIH